MASNSLLRAALAMNAVFSLATGCVLVAFGSGIATLIFVRPGGWAGSWVLRGVGLSLIGFAVLLSALARDNGVALKQVFPIVLSDLAWTLLSLALVLLAPEWVTRPGGRIVAVAAVIVASLAALQWHGGRLAQLAA